MNDGTKGLLDLIVLLVVLAIAMAALLVVTWVVR